MTRIALIISFLLFAFCACFGQSTFQGLTPGKSTRAEVERVLGRPVKQVSQTLVEYLPQILLVTDSGYGKSHKTYVQYRDSSTAVVAERIEFVLCASSSISCDLVPSMHRQYDFGLTSSSWGGTLDARLVSGDKTLWYFGGPRYMVRTDILKTSPTESSSETRWAFYSKELYEAAMPALGNCTGMLRGEWDTNRGRTAFTRGNEIGRLKGTYADNNGSFTGEIQGDILSGEWKDNTGSGTMFLQLYYPGAKQFTGWWKRTSGTGAAEGTWEGRCV